MNKLKPLTGQVLVEVLPPDTVSPSGIHLPQNVPVSADIVQESHSDPEKPAKNNLGIVRSIGAWPKLPCGLALLPEFRVGQRVYFNPFRGKSLRSNGRMMRLIRQEDVLAVVS